MLKNHNSKKHILSSVLNVFCSIFCIIFLVVESMGLGLRLPVLGSLGFGTWGLQFGFWGLSFGVWGLRF